MREAVVARLLREIAGVYTCAHISMYQQPTNAQSAEMPMRDSMNNLVGIAQAAEISISATLNKLSDAAQTK